MIIGRISQGIRNQDWFVVMVEVMIVVVGIFIGLQVDDWNEGRKERIEEMVYLERLLDELNYNKEILKTDLAISIEYASNALQIAEAFSLDNLNGMTEAEFQSKFLNIVFWNRLEFHDATIKEMMSTGKISIIQSQQIRNTISNILLVVETRGIVSTNVGKLLMYHWQKIVPKIETVIVDGKEQLLSDTNELLANQQIQQHVIDMVKFHNLIPEDSIVLLNTLDNLINLVSEEIENRQI